MTGWPVRVGHSLNMIAELPEWVDDDAYPPVIRAAALDSLYVHLYLLTGLALERAAAAGDVLPVAIMAELGHLHSFVARNVLAPLYADDGPAEPFVLIDAERARKDARLVIAAMEQLA